ncbi:MAG: DUF4870 domain-containing protein [Gammaproteobacteria bacterium HGW-Gammaproteobacteria-11]|nr:MAG: DUF4870 domain-containing protein [Gammaproteobacteria bacterium HGW-Gammaproteobacteria-11]
MTDTQQSPDNHNMPNAETRQWAMFAHLSGFIGCVFPFGNLIGPLVVWQLKKDEEPFLDDQGKEALNFQITVSLLFIICLMLVVVVIGILLLGLLFVGAAVLMIIAAIKSNEGKAYRYPFCWRIIK